MFLDHRRLLGPDPSKGGKTEKPPYGGERATIPQTWGKSIANIVPKNRAVKLSPTEVFLFLFFDNADMNGTTMETEKKTMMIMIEIRILGSFIDMLNRKDFDAAKWRIFTDTMENL